MDVYILEPFDHFGHTLILPSDIIEGESYHSCIWTERFNTAGDFELVTVANRSNRGKLDIGTLLGVKNSRRIMIVETVDVQKDEEGKQVLKVTGPSLEKVFENRVIFSKESPTTNPKDEVNYIIDKAIINPDIPEDKLFSITLGIPEGQAVNNDPEGHSPLDPSTPYTSMEAIRNYCEVYPLGFAILRDSEGELTAGAYVGHDRTSYSPGLGAIMFSEGLENIKNTSMHSSVAEYKNVAYVVSNGYLREVYMSTSALGPERRVVLVRADDIEESNPERDIIMGNLGLEALSQHKREALADGEATPNVSYEYDKDYFLGDVVLMEHHDGMVTHMRITEQIFVNDAEGFSSYPTLSMEQEVIPGTWYSEPYRVDWPEIDEDWDEQP